MGAAPLAGGRPLHLPGLPGVRPGTPGRRGHARRARGVGPRRAAFGPERLDLVRLPAGRGTRQGPRAQDAGAYQGKLALDGAPPGLPRLRRRQDIRRRRAGQRGAPLPRPVHLVLVHAERPADPGAAPQGARGPRRLGLRDGQPQRQGPARDPRDLPARRAVPDLGRAVAADGPGRAAPAGAQADPAVPAQGRLRTLHVLPGLPAAGPLHHRRPAGDGADPPRHLPRFVGRLHRAGVRVGAGPPALRRSRGQARDGARCRRGRARAATGRRDALVGRRLRGRPRRPVRRGGGQPAAQDLRRSVS